jgi:hypothetical protein
MEIPTNNGATVLLTLSKTADVIEYSLAREALFACGYGATRIGDNLHVYSCRESSSLHVSLGDPDEHGNRRPQDETIEELGQLYCDEGHYSDCQTDRDGSTGFNSPWMELCDMNALLRMIVLRYNPECDFERSPYMGRGWSARHYHSQYIAALDELAQQPDSAFAADFDWQAPEVETEAETAQACK